MVINKKAVRLMSSNELELNAQTLGVMIMIERSQRGLTGRLEDLQTKKDMIMTALVQRQIEGFKSLC